MRRREFLKDSTLKALTALAGASWFLNACHTEEDMIGDPAWIIEGAFNRALPVPSNVTGGTTLTAQYSASEILKNKSSTTMAYGDGLLGPTLRAGKGETFNALLQNNLNEETNIHWHGLILPESMDGHPKDVASVGGSYSYSLPIQQRAGTYWYHPHPHGMTGKQVFMGLAGMFIVNDAEEASLNLPDGEFEVPIIIQDKHFSGSSLDYSPTDDEIMTGYLGEQIIVNGIHAPVLNVASGWYRFRILNGSTARVYDLAMSGGIPIHIIGADGGLLRSTETTSHILLGPGERLDILIDFSNLTVGTEVFLVSNAFMKYNPQGRQSFKILKFKVDRASRLVFNLPSALSSFEMIHADHASAIRTFEIGKMEDGEGGHGGMPVHTINGKVFEMHRVDALVAAGSTEIWEFDNLKGDEFHPMHIHGVQFQVLERVGGRKMILPSEKAWKDTVLVMPGEKVSVIMTFPQNPGVFVMHCHNLEHEDSGMMMNFQIA